MVQGTKFQDAQKTPKGDVLWSSCLVVAPREDCARKSFKDDRVKGVGPERQSTGGKERNQSKKSSLVGATAIENESALRNYRQRPANMQKAVHQKHFAYSKPLKL